MGTGNFIKDNTMHSKLKGDIGVIKVILDMTVKGYAVFTPMSENTKTDLAVQKDNNKLLRLQVKYTSKDTFILPRNTCWSDCNGIHMTAYIVEDFDYYAVYFSLVDKVVYLPSTCIGKTVRCVAPENNAAIYWYEDFLDIPDYDTEVLKKRLRETKKYVPKPKAATIKRVREIKNVKEDKVAVPRATKIEWLPDDELKELVWKTPRSILSKQLGVSDKAIAKRLNLRGISQPPRGYWAKLAAGKVNQ